MRMQSKLVGNMVLVLALLGGLSIILAGCGDDTGIKNNAPTFSAIGGKSVSEGETLAFNVSATDRDNDAITLLMENQPANSQFVDNGDGTGSFTFTPNYSQDGTLQTTFIATDGLDQTSEIVEITVADRAFTHHSGTIAENESWSASDNPHLVSSDIDVTGNAILTIENGCEVFFIEGKRIRVGYLGPGGLQASGTTFTSVSDNPTRGIWDGLGFAGQTINSSLDDCTIEYGGGNGFGNIFVQDGALAINGCWIENSSTNGIYFLGEGHVTEFDGNVISNNAAYPVTVPCNYLGGLQGSSLTGNDKDTVIVGGTLVSASASWDTLGVPFLITERLEIAGGATVSLVPGLTLSFDPGAGIIVGETSAGALIADGTEKEILFTSSVPSPTAGEWEGLSFGEFAETSCLLVNCIVEYAGESQDGAIYVEDAEVAINSTTVRHADEYGVYFTGEGRFSSFDNNLLTANGTLPLLIGANYAGDLSASNTYTGNSTDQVEVTGDVIDRIATWDDLGVPYYVSGVARIEDGGILTLAPGLTALFSPEGRLLVGETGPGTLIADGSAGEITLSSASGTAFWQGIHFLGNATANSLLDSCTIDRAGLQQGAPIDGGISLSDCQMHIRHCMITNGGNIGVSFIGTAYPLSFTGNTVTGGNSYPVSIDCDYIGELPSGNDLTGNSDDAIQLGGDQITASTTWEDPGIPLTISELIFINMGIQLTLSPGLELRFSAGSGLRIEQNAALIADGTADQINFTADVPGRNWEGLNFRPGASSASSLISCLIDEGGNQRNYDASRSRYPGCVHVDDCHVTIINCTISGSKSVGIFFKEDGYADNLTGNDIVNNDGRPIRVEVPTVHRLDADNNFTGNGEDIIEIGGDLENDDRQGTLTQSVTWSDMGIPYNVLDSVKICGSAQLTIEEGVTLQMTSQMNFTVCSGASLVAEGTAANPITFEAISSHWGAITMGGGSNNNSALTNCIIDTGGRGRCGIVKLVDCNPRITDCSISNSFASSQSCGICLNGTAEPGTYEQDNTFANIAGSNVCSQ